MVIIWLDLLPVSCKNAASEMTIHLHKFTALSVLEFGGVDRHAVHIPGDDRARIRLCGEACESLTSIALSTQILNSPIISGSLTYSRLVDENSGNG
jgi:hypothetical protein